MAHDGKYDHFHVVSICVECAEISIIAIAKDTEALEKFFDTLESELLSAATIAPFAPKDMEFNVEIVVPNQIAKITPLDGHERGHVVVCVAHKCSDPFAFCYDKQREISIKAMATEAAKRLFKSMQEHSNSDNNLNRGKNKEKESDQARRLLESLDLPDDLFRGMN